MIQGVHTMFYTSEPEALRVFIRDVLGFSAHDVGGGWLLFDLPEADMGCHPSGTADGKPPGTAAISFYCQDLVATMAELTAKGVAFLGEPTDQGYGLVTSFEMPGGVTVDLYQPNYAKP